MSRKGRDTFVIRDPTTGEPQSYAYSMLQHSIDFATAAISTCAEKMIRGDDMGAAYGWGQRFSTWADGVIYWKQVLDQLERVRDQKRS